VSLRERLRRSADVADLRVLGEAVVLIVATWLVLGWSLFDRAITQADGTVLVVPFTQSALHAGPDWTEHLYRFGVVGGSQMHDFAGTMPIIQLCSLLGLSTTTTVNIITIFIQLCFGFFGVKLVEALISEWSGVAQRLSWVRRICTQWGCAFAPILGWRLAIGHENLLIGILPLVVTIAMLWAARARTLSAVALAMGAFAVFNGVSGLGPQTVVYSAVFGLPFVMVTILDAPRGRRWSTAHTAVVCSVAAGVLVALPRLAGMIQHALGDDASRSLSESVVYSYGRSEWTDWLASIPWTEQVAARWNGTNALHEHNYPVGPLLVFVLALWPRGVSRRMLWGMLAGVVLAIIVADDLAPLSSAVLAIIPPLESFRVPARAVLPILVFVPSVAMAVVWRSVGTEPSDRGTVRVQLLGVVIALVVILTRGATGPWAREVIAWLACLALAIVARWRPDTLRRYTLGASVPVIIALGVAAFDDRFPRQAAFDPVEHGPAQLHDAVLAQAPDVAMPLTRIQIVDAPQPYEMSTAFAARLPSLDGVWYPPRRFLQLLSALQGREIAATTAVFALTRSSMFPVLQQLYNVRYVVSLANGKGAIEELPDTAGPAWFPARIDTVENAAEVARILREHRADLRAAVSGSAWMLRVDAARAPRVAGCTDGRVTSVTTDDIGQTASISVEVRSDCVLVVATNYVSTLSATVTRGDTLGPIPVFPIDVALTGIAVPRGTSTVVLGPVASIPWWSRAGQLGGVLLLIVAVAVAVALRRSSPAAAGST
jgi:hypothetical protein